MEINHVGYQNHLEVLGLAMISVKKKKIWCKTSWWIIVKLMACKIYIDHFMNFIIKLLVIKFKTLSKLAISEEIVNGYRYTHI